ncbi:MAG: hypothetical protein CMB13_01285, partial [Euryarchaeota archaeon]|nr:hypothetical protein [Euryarchaeota archaeon]
KSATFQLLSTFYLQKKKHLKEKATLSIFVTEQPDGDEGDERTLPSPLEDLGGLGSPTASLILTRFCFCTRFRRVN